MRMDEIGRQPCSVARALAELGDAWSVLIVREAFYGRQRFSDFVKYTGAQKTVVSARLKALVEVGILQRFEYSEHPVRHGYALTDKGRALAPVYFALANWGDNWLDGGNGAPIEFMHSCGHHVGARQVCAHCGDDVEPRDVVPRVGPGFPGNLPDVFARD